MIFFVGRFRHEGTKALRNTKVRRKGGKRVGAKIVYDNLFSMGLRCIFWRKEKRKRINV